MKKCKRDHEYDYNLERCPTCRKLSSYSWYIKNQEYKKKYRSEWYLSNKQAENVKSYTYRKFHPELKEYLREYKSNNKEKTRIAAANWYKKNSARSKANAAKRRAMKIEATPKWLSKDHLNEIYELYRLAKELAWLNQDGKPFHVDHIIPLQGDNVCGLHVPWNLQLLPWKDNLKKSNNTGLV